MANLLFSEVVKLTGLPATHIETEFSELLKEKGYNPENLTLEELRDFTSSFLKDVFGEN